MVEVDDRITLVPNGGWDERILVCRCGELVDTFIVVTARYLVVADTLFNTATADALRAIAGPWRAGRQMLAINTHADWDHAWGNHRFAGPDAPDQVPIIATTRCAKRLRSAEAADQLRAMQREQPGRFDDVLLTPPTLLFDLWERAASRRPYGFSELKRVEPVQAGFASYSRGVYAHGERFYPI